MIAGSDKAFGTLQIRSPQTSCFWMGIYGLIQVALWFKIMLVRVPNKTPETLNLRNLASTTDDGNLRATRAHGNYAENAPIFAIMLFAADVAGIVPANVVDATGFAFATGRFLHALGLYADGGETIGRIGGAVLTMSSLIAVAIQCLFSAFALCGGRMCRIRLLGLVTSFLISKAIAGLRPGR